MGRRLAVALGGLLLAACGYRFAADGGPLPKGVGHVAVPTLKNLTAETYLSAWLTEELRRELARGGHGEEQGAEARLDGTIEQVGGGPLALKSAAPFVNGQPVAGAMLAPANPGLYSAQVTVTVRLWRGAELLAEVDHFQRQEPYLPSDDLATMEANRRLALRRLAATVARELVARLEAAP